VLLWRCSVQFQHCARCLAPPLRCRCWRHIVLLGYEPIVLARFLHVSVSVPVAHERLCRIDPVLEIMGSGRAYPLLLVIGARSSDLLGLAACLCYWHNPISLVFLLGRPAATDLHDFFFIGLINWGFHVFIENGDDNVRSNTVQSLTLIGGSDDFFGEDDHAAHHNQSNVFWRDVPALQKSQRDTKWAKEKASVLQGYDIYSFSMTVLMKAWPLLADRYVDTTRTMTKNEIEKLLEVRVTQRECPHTELLPPVPDKRVNHHPEGPPPELPEGSAMYLALDQKLKRFQFNIAKVLDLGMPPIKPLDELDLYQPSANQAVSEGAFPEEALKEKALSEKERKKVS